MSRSGYTDDDCDGFSLAMWRGQVASTIRGKRGQAFIRELIAALEELPEKRLISRDLGSLNIARRTYEVCALGSVGVRRGMKMEALDPEDPISLAAAFGITHQLISEIEFLNDEAYCGQTPEGRWRFMYEWATAQVEKVSAPLAKAAE